MFASTGLTRAKTTAVSSSVVNAQKFLANIDWEDSQYWEFNEEEVKQTINELTLVQSARTPEDIDNAVTQKFRSSITSATFAKVKSEKAILQYSDVTEKDKTAEIKLDPKKVRQIMQTLLVFAFLHGNITNKKFWIKIMTNGEGNSIYIGLPTLNSVGNRSTLVHYFKNEISAMLKEGLNNTLTTILARSKIEVKKEKRAYLFAKGHLLVKKEEIPLVRDDLTKIFSQFSVPVESRKFELKWFVV